jgi:hypothetical protein
MNWTESVRIKKDGKRVSTSVYVSYNLGKNLYDHIDLSRKYRY